MDTKDLAERRVAAAEEFNRQEQRGDGPRVTEQLIAGLTLLRDLLYDRVHADVEERVGMDSMLMPVSEEKTKRIASLEIELYEIASSAATVKERRYVRAADEWYLTWLTRLFLGPIHADERVTKRLAHYLAKTPDDRRLAFSNVLAVAMPESRRAPLVLFRLLPQAVWIATATAFGSADDARCWRRQQAEIQPAISDCHECHGKVLENSQQCRACGNPLWRFDWLAAAD